MAAQRGGKAGGWRQGLRRLAGHVVRPLLWALVAGVALQLFFVARIALMLVLDPASTTFQRSEAYRLATQSGPMPWKQQWVPYEQISVHLKRAVIASEDALFASHGGVDWNAIERARERNARASERSQRSNRTPRVVGGSTITQQLAKNLFLTGERTLLRKGQELVLALMLEALLSKERLLEIYLNHVEWGAGIFGAEAAAQHYYKKPAARLTPREAARLAVMLPSPKFFERRQNSAYLERRAGTIAARMADAQLP